MAWTSPMTFVAGSALTASQLNTYVAANLNEMAPAKALTVGRIFVSTGANTLIERAVSSAVVATAQTTTSISYTDLATVGPAVTLTTGTQAIVALSALIANATAPTSDRMSFAVSGATTLAAADSNAIMHSESGTTGGSRLCAITRVTLTAGSNTFTAKYKTSSSTATFTNRRIVVIGL